MIDYSSMFACFVRGQMGPFYQYMYPGLLTFASRLLGPSLAFMAEDCVQDAVMLTYQRSSELDDTDHWRWYMMKCVRSRAANLLRHKGVVDVYASGFPDEDALTDRDISYDMIRQETLDTLFAAIDRLPEELRVIFRLNFEEGLKNAEIAERLNVAEITVKKRKARMLSLLRQWLGSDIDTALVLLLLSIELSE